MKWEEFKAVKQPLRAVLWADGILLGEIYIKELPYVQNSEYFFCSVCQEVWAYLEFQNTSWMPIHVTCKDHVDERSEYYLPGSMFEGYQLDHIPSELLPNAFIAREFLLHLNWAEKESEHGKEANTTGDLCK